MHDESGQNKRFRTMRKFISDPRSTGYLMFILIAVLFVAEMIEVYFYAFIEPFPKWAIAASHVMLLFVFIHYIKVYRKYRSQSDKLLEMNEQLLKQITEREQKRGKAPQI